MSSSISMQSSILHLLNKEKPTIIDILLWRAKNQPDRIAYTFMKDDEINEQTLTYSQLLSQVQSVAHKLQKEGLTGERAVLLYSSSLEYITTFLGCLYAGVIAVPAFPPDPTRLKVTLPKLQGVIKDSQAKAILTNKKLMTFAYLLMQYAPELKKLKWIETESISRGKKLICEPHDISGDDIAFLQYTSGSTSSPKGVMISHWNIVHNEYLMATAFGTTEDTIIGGWLPLYHNMGLIGNVLQPLYMGCQLVFTSPLTFLQKPLSWLRMISKYKINTSGGPNFAFDLCAQKATEKDKETLDLSSWTVAFVGSEPVRKSMLESFSERFASCGFEKGSLYPAYGLAEATLMVSCVGHGKETSCINLSHEAFQKGVIEETADNEGNIWQVTCGTTYLGQEMRIVNPDTLEACPENKIGELWVSGESVAKGYWKNPEATKTTFEARLSDSDKKYMRTGDLGFMKNGELYITGRLKDLIIINGKNYYPQDIEETVAKSNPLIQPDSVAAFTIDGRATEELVIVAEVRNLEKERIKEKGFIKSKLLSLKSRLFKENDNKIVTEDILMSIQKRVFEEHNLVPHHKILIKHQTIPKTASNKIQRHACKKLFLENNLDVLDRQHVKESQDRKIDLPQTPLQEELCGIFCEVLNLDQVGINENFFELGGHSLLATQLISRLESGFKVKLPPSKLFEATTVAGLARVIEEAESKDRISSGDLEILPVSRDENIPLSFSQERLWFIDQLEPDSAGYNIPAAIRIKGDLNTQILEESFTRIVERHETLRTAFQTEDGKPIQIINEPYDFHIPIVDLRAEEEKENKAKEIAAKEAKTSFNLSKGPLLRAKLIKLEENEHILVVNMHHIISDGWSMGVFIRELSLNMNSLLNGEMPFLEPLSFQYADFGAWQRQWLEKGEMEKQLGYWREKLSSPPDVLNLPIDYPRPPVQTSSGSTLRFEIPSDLTTKLKEITMQEGATLFMTLLSAFNVLLHKLSGDNDICVGSPIANRNRKEIEGLIGFFLNTLVLRNKVEGSQSFTELLKEVRTTTLGAYDHQDMPVEKLLEELTPERDLSYTPLFQVMMILQNTPMANIDLGDVHITPFKIETDIAKFDLTLELEEIKDVLKCKLEYNTDLFKKDTVSRIITYYLRVLETVVDNKDVKIADIELLDEVEKNKLLTEWKGISLEHTSEKFIHQLFDEQVDKTSDNIALAFAGKKMTYRELNEKANQLAHTLRLKGIKSESVVAIIADKSPEMIVGILGVLKSGGAYLPISPDYPEERIKFMLQDTNAKLILTQPHLMDKVIQLYPPLEKGGGGINSEIFNLNDENIYSSNTSNLSYENKPTDLAYIIYTSGSTGKAKGVMIEHGQIGNHIPILKSCLTLEHSVNVALLASFTFDASLEQIFFPLTTGGKLYLPNKAESLEADNFWKAMADEQINVIDTVPTYMESLMEGDSCKFYSEVKDKYFIMGGETFSKELLNKFTERFPDAKIYNTYGPTETTVNAAVYNVSNDFDSRTIPIGKPLPGYDFYVLDANGKLFPPGVPGELCIGGVCLARGYLNRPDLTSEKFINNPFQKGEKIYRSGDLVKWLPDGNIEYLGRIDTQVKIRGFRIECGEIESALSQNENIKDAVVVAHKEKSGDNKLIAYIVLKNAENTLNSADFKIYLSGMLPDYMIPSYFVNLDKLPLNSSGKIDRKALPKPDKALMSGNKEYAASKNETEEKLVKIWQDLLKVDNIGVNDNFFELGGDSILSIQIISRAKANGLHLTAKDIFMYQTIRELARVAKTSKVIHADQSLITGKVETGAIQKWFLNEHKHGDENHYNQFGLTKVHKDLDIESLEKVINKLVDHHDMLRSSFKEEDGQWVQVLKEKVPSVKISCFDLSGKTKEEQNASIKEIAQKLQRNLNLKEGKLIDVAHFKTSIDEFDRLFIVIHHLVVDGVSWRIFLEDMIEGYATLRSRGKIFLPEKTTSFDYWINKLSQYAQTEEARKEIPYWSGLLDGKQEIKTPVDNPAGSNLVAESKTLSVNLTSKETKIFLEEIPGVYHSHVNDLLLTGLLNALCKWTGEDRGCWLIEQEGHGREELFEEVDTSRTIGWFTSVYPVLLEKSGEGTGELIKKVKENLRKMPNHGTGFGILKYLSGDAELKEKLSKLKSRICFNYLGQFQSVENSSFIESIATEPVGTPHSEKADTAYELYIEGIVTGGELQITVNYSKEKYEDGNISRFVSAIRESLVEIIEHCLSPEAGGYTPSDFPLANLSQQELDKLIRSNPTIEDLYPLSPMQQGMLFHTLMDSESGVYFEHMRFKFEDLKIAEFKKAWEQVLKTESVFRTSFKWEGLKEPLQFVEKSVELPFEYLDWTEMEDQETELKLLCEAEEKKGFQLDKAPLMRVIVIKLNNNEYEVIWNFHHLLMDGWSVPLVLKQLLDTYEALIHGDKTDGASSGSYREYISWLGKQDMEKAAQYWTTALAGLEGPTHLGIEQVSYKQLTDQRIEEEILVIEESMIKAMEEQNRKHGLTMNTWIQGAWGFVMSQYSRDENVVFGATVAGRGAEVSGIDEMIGLFINTLPLKIEVKSDLLVKEYLAKIQNTNVDQRQYEYSSLTDIKKWSGIREDLFENILVFENYPLDESLNENKNLKLSDLVVVEKTNYPLTLSVLPGKNIRLQALYNINCYTRESILRLLRHFKLALEGMLANAENPLESIELLDEAEKHKVLTEWNNTSADYPIDKCIHQLFEEQVDKTPDNIAVVFQDKSLTYAELNARSNQLARYLRDNGLKAEKIAGICVDRSLEMIIGVMAILKAGGAYVPIDPNLPEERIAYLLQDSNADLLLIENKLINKVKFNRKTVYINDERNYSEDKSNLETDVKSDNLAYIIYTSGSTGKPKGAMVEHRSVINISQGWTKEYGLDSMELNLLQLANFSFDVFTGDLARALPNGGKLIIADTDVKLDPSSLYSLLTNEKISIFEATPALALPVMDYIYDNNLEIPYLKVLILGSDSFSIEDYRKLLLRFGEKIRVINSYGVTEVTIDSSYYEESLNNLIATGNTPIGKPFQNTQYYVLDKKLKVQPIGILGELFIGGDGVARGYWNKPELTTERFIENPFANIKQSPFDKGGKRGISDRLYRTGDLARWLPDGNMDFIGRIDHQVKIRGFRIECGEIETVLAQNENIKEAVVVPYKEPGRENVLVAYISFRNEESILTSTDLRAILSKQLPDYMIPSYFVHLDKLPLNPSGKIDRKALPKPDKTLGGGSEYVAPRNETEEKLAAIWQEILKVEKIGIYDNFFDLGGHSLLATQVISRIRETFDSEIPVRALFEHSTVEELAGLLSQKSGSIAPEILPVSRDDNLPLSYAQERLWFLDQLEPESAGYNMPDAIRISGELKVEILEQSFSRIIERHETLRTVFQEQDGKPVQIIKNPEPFRIPVTDLSNAEDKEYEAREIAIAEANSPFNLSTGPLLRAKLIKLEEKESVLVVNMHHIISDGWSVSILISELGQIMNSLVKGKTAELEPLKLQYADFTVWQRKWLEGGELGRQLTYWKEQLSDSPDFLHLPTDYPRPAIQTYNGSIINFTIPENLTTRLNDICQKEGVTLFMALLASFNVLLSKITGEEDICTGTPIANRNRKETEGLIGFFVNTLVLRNKIDHKQSFSDLLKNVKHTTLGAYDHQDVPFEKLVEAMSPGRDMSYSPLFQVMMAMQNTPNEDIDSGDLKITPFDMELKVAKFDLTLNLEEKGNKLEGIFEYNTDLFQSDTISRIIKYYLRILETVSANREVKIEDIELLDEEEKHKLLVKWNDTKVDYPRDKCIHQLFEEQVEKTPDNIALIFEDKKMTYRELNEKSNQLANYLRNQGIKKEDIVALIAEPSIEMIYGLLGILKSGAAYLPIDPKLPEERINFILQDTRTKLIITHKNLSDNINCDVKKINMDNYDISISASDNPKNLTEPADLAYIIYTSGSTGKPKGVMIEHGSFGIHSVVLQNTLTSEHPFNVPFLASFTFDASLEQIFTPLITGGKLYIPAKDESLEIDEFWKSMAEKQVNVIDMVPTHMEALLAGDAWKIYREVENKYFIMGGEVFSKSLSKKLKACFPDAMICNRYGPTETTITASEYNLTDETEEKSIPIGKPLPGYEFYVLDGQGKLLPPGIPGELCIGGLCVARGYLNRPELTAEKFIPNPFAISPSDFPLMPEERARVRREAKGAGGISNRLYKTGDLARWLPDGNIEYLGRIDTQVKIRGFRIECGEIEDTLLQQENIKNAVVVAHKESNGEKSLAAYIVLKDSDMELELQNLKEILDKKLPNYMIPSYFIQLDSLPLNSSGKLNRKALPKPDKSLRVNREYVAPRNDTEEKLAAIWQEILKVERIGIYDNFFDLGGHSLLATQVISRIRKHFDAEIPVRELFESPTIERLAQFCEDSSDEYEEFEI